MRTIASILLVIFCMSGRAQEPVNTRSKLALKNKRYGAHHYKVLHQYYSDTSQYLHTIWKINITKDDNIIASLRLPVPDDEAKNFGVNKIAETVDGFLIAADWGSGNYFYNNTYYFVYKYGQFYLRDIDWILYIHEPEKTESYHKKLRPALAIPQIDMLRYLGKE